MGHQKSGLIRGVTFDERTLIRGVINVTGLKATPLIRPDEGAMGENLLH
jgi:hypothetical protein